MELQSLKSKIAKISAHIDEYLENKNTTKTEKVLFKSAKLPEEVGEFYSELLIHLDFARKEKVGTSEKLKKELADVIITSLVIAEELEIDIFHHIEQKIEKVYERFWLKND